MKKNDLTWKIEQGRRDRATKEAEDIVRTLDDQSLPLDPIAVAAQEGDLLRLFPDDYGNDFDGRLECRIDRRRFLLYYNTKYNRWPHNGRHHPKVRFSIAHELGHYFLDEHRQYLTGGGRSHGSMSEFESQDDMREQEADAFATGLLMPSHLVSPIINSVEPSYNALKRAAANFDVSLTSMMIRWVGLTHFPCAMVSIRQGRLEWGFTSEAFKRRGGVRVRRGSIVVSRAASRFITQEPTFSHFREGEGEASVADWIACDLAGGLVSEYYVAIPHTRQLLVFLVADEDDFMADDDED